MATFYVYELRSIDAWREPEGGWAWNDSFRLEEGIVFQADQLTPRKLLRHLRTWGYLKLESKGKARVVDDQDELIEIQAKGTGQPVLALLFTKTINDDPQLVAKFKERTA